MISGGLQWPSETATLILGMPMMMTEKEQR